MEVRNMSEAKVWIRKRSLAKGRTSYHLRWVCPTQHKWLSRHVGGDRKRAERERAKLEAELDVGSYRAEKCIDWPTFVAGHVDMIEGKVNAAEAKRTLTEFGKVCQPGKPKDVAFAMVERYYLHLRTKGNALPTRNKRLRYLRAAFNKAIKRGYMATNPMVGWQWEREEQKIPRCLTDAEKTLLLDACPSDQWRAFMFVALTTGCRRGELLGLTWDRVDFDNAQIVVTATKAHKDRVQPMNDESTVMLRELQATTLKDGGPFVAFQHLNVPQRFTAIVVTAGIDHCTFHDLRRTFCTDLARLGVNQLVVQRLAGHASSTTTAKFYQHIDDDMKRDAINKLKRRSVG